MFKKCYYYLNYPLTIVTFRGQLGNPYDTAVILTPFKIVGFIGLVVLLGIIVIKL